MALLQKYWFGPSRSYWLLHQGRRYDSKAIVGATHGYAAPGMAPLSAVEFSGGECTIQRKFEEFGFVVEVATPDPPGSSIHGDRTSQRLTRRGRSTNIHPYRGPDTN